MQLFSVDQQRSQALEAHAASFATFKVWVSFAFCFIWVFHLWLCSVIFIFMLFTGCREWKSVNSNLFCLKDLECWTTYIQTACYWTWCPARSVNSSLAVVLTYKCMHVASFIFSTAINFCQMDAFLKLVVSVTRYRLLTIMPACTDYGFLLSGKASFTKKQADLFFPPDFADDFPVSMQVS